jgi:hypothetical protein
MLLIDLRNEKFSFDWIIDNYNNTATLIYKDNNFELLINKQAFN